MQNVLVFTVQCYTSALYAVCLSQAGTVPKRLNVGSHKQCCSPGTHSFLIPKISVKFEWGHPYKGAK